MNVLEDEFWSARAVQLAAAAGSDARAALVVRRGRSVAEAVHLRGAPELTAIAQASPRACGATLYIAHPPDDHAVELARRARIERLVIARGPLDHATVGRWVSAGIRVDHVAVTGGAASSAPAARPPERLVSGVRR